MTDASQCCGFPNIHKITQGAQKYLWCESCQRLLEELDSNGDIITPEVAREKIQLLFLKDEEEGNKNGKTGSARRRIERSLE